MISPRLVPDPEPPDAWLCGDEPILALFARSQAAEAAGDDTTLARLDAEIAASPMESPNALAVAAFVVRRQMARGGLDEAGRQLLSVVLYAVVSLAVETA